ncbi:MAG: hypothetical protein H0V81_11795 [Solirubrobacterales bacterium]|nr:hypothetical protein [Solirubrobacterales bacterium]
MLSDAATIDDPHADFFRKVAEASANVLVFKADAALLDGVPERTAQVLAQRVRLPRIRLTAGHWEPARPECAEGEVLGLLVLDGLLERTADVGSRSGPELLGPGDFLRPWDPAPEGGTACSWRVHERVELAVLDDRFSSVACRVPRVLANLLSRTALRSHGLAVRLAIGQVRCAEDRVLFVLQAMAERWGCETPEGVHLPFALQHDTIGRLACMRRPTTSTALIALQRSGRLLRCADRTWLLPEEAATGVTSTARPVQRAA